MVYESSYESGRQPFLPDAKRGFWAHPHDFIYVALCAAFRVDMPSYFIQERTGLLCYFLVYLLSLALYIVPFMVLQFFLGQFSSSGFISAFRISPLFKGIGYVTLVLNICVVAYSSVYAIVPLLYMFASMNPTLPWSCEGFKSWAIELTEEEEINLCNLKFDNESFIPNDSVESTNATDNINFINHNIPSILYFTTMFHDRDNLFNTYSEFSMAWQLIICSLLVWTMVALAMYKLFDTELFGTIIRHSFWIIIGLLCLLLVRFAFLPGAGSVLHHNLSLSWKKLSFNLYCIPFNTITFGPGWGLLITLGSFNKFKTNIMKSSCIIAVGQIFIMIGLTLLMAFTERYFLEVTEGNYYALLEGEWSLYLSSGSVMAHMAWANLWSILFYFMLFLSAMTVILIQLKSILTTIYDEFVFLREKKFEVSISLLGLLTTCSLYFSSGQGISAGPVFWADAFINQNGMNLLLILVVLWIYGRERFQRDIEFMTSIRFSTWFVNILRFAAPLGFGIGLLEGVLISYHVHPYSHISIAIIGIIFVAMPWLCIPGYVIYLMRMALGPIRTRFFRCCHPTDWFPVEIEYHQKYDEIVGNAEITQTFGEMGNQANS